MDLSKIVVCSFYTADDYYRGHAEKLEKNLSELGVAHELREIVAAEGEDWADICRKKIGFLNEMCTTHADSLVFWIDVDCRLVGLPDYVANTTADLIGFQRGFSAPASIGYANRTRFWEPCFFGINATRLGRKFMSDAAALEQDLEIKATDDYFFEESWRANSPSMTFQVISSGAVVDRPNGGDVQAFFEFGSSGNVDEFKGKVVQHAGFGPASRSLSPRKRALKLAKSIERWLTARSGPTASRLRLLADKLGVTHVLTSGAKTTGDPKRAKIVKDMVQAGRRGQAKVVDKLAGELNATGILSHVERGSQQVAQAFAHHASTGEGKPIPMMWWTKPFPGNFGDWLSPLIVGQVSGQRLVNLEPSAPTHQPHLVSLGSIGRFIKPKSIVVGTGISTTDLTLESKASFVSLRGPVTAEVLRNSGGPDVESFGDPGVLLSRVIPLERGETNGRVAFVRHFTHAALPATLPENWDELNVLVSRPADIEAFVQKLIGYDAVVTSAMHVMIICHSYGIPVALVSFSGFEEAVHGSGIKYRDYCMGAELTSVWEPVPVNLNLTATNFDDLIHTERVSEAKLDEVETAIRTAVEQYRAITS